MRTVMTSVVADRDPYHRNVILKNADSWQISTYLWEISDPISKNYDNMLLLSQKKGIMLW